MQYFTKILHNMAFLKICGVSAVRAADSRRELGTGDDGRGERSYEGI